MKDNKHPYRSQSFAAMKKKKEEKNVKKLFKKKDERDISIDRLRYMVGVSNKVDRKDK